MANDMTYLEEIIRQIDVHVRRAGFFAYPCVADNAKRLIDAYMLICTQVDVWRRALVTAGQTCFTNNDITNAIQRLAAQKAPTDIQQILDLLDEVGWPSCTKDIKGILKAITDLSNSREACKSESDKYYHKTKDLEKELQQVRKERDSVKADIYQVKQAVAQQGYYLDNALIDNVTRMIKNRNDRIVILEKALDRSQEDLANAKRHVAHQDSNKVDQLTALLNTKDKDVTKLQESLNSVTKYKDSLLQSVRDALFSAGYTAHSITAMVNCIKDLQRRYTEEVDARQNRVKTINEQAVILEKIMMDVTHVCGINRENETPDQYLARGFDVLLRTHRETIAKKDKKMGDMEDKYINLIKVSDKENSLLRDKVKQLEGKYPRVSIAYTYEDRLTGAVMINVPASTKIQYLENLVEYLDRRVITDEDRI